MVCFKTILGFIISREGKTLDLKNMEAIVKMPIPKTLQEIQVFNIMAQFYICFIINFSSIMAPITKLLKKIEIIERTVECQIDYEDKKSIHSSSHIHQFRLGTKFLCSY
jgi:hypothetical protein